MLATALPPRTPARIFELVDLVAVKLREKFAQLPIVRPSEEGERRNQRPGADASYQVEVRTVATLTPAHEQTGTERAILTATREREDVRLQRLALPAARLILGLQAWKLHRFEVFQRGRLVSPPADIRKILDLGLLDQFKGHEGTVG